MYLNIIITGVHPGSLPTLLGMWVKCVHLRGVDVPAL